MTSSPNRILAALFIAEILVTFESTMIYAALPTLIREFGDPLQAGWLVTIHLLIAAATAPVAGRLGDIYGRKTVIMVLLALALIGSLISAMSSVFLIILAGRAIQGFCTAILPLAVGVVREGFPAAKVPVAIGVLTTAQGVGSATGLVFGGAIVDNLNWQGLFWASAILSVVALLAVGLIVPAKAGTPPREPINWTEGLLPIPAVAAIMFALGLTKQHGWLDPYPLSIFATGFVLLALWGWMSLKSREPFIDLRLFGIRNFAVANLMQILLGMSTMHVIFVMSAYMQSPAWTMVGLGLTATLAGVAKLPSNVLAFFAGPFSGWMTTRAGAQRTVMAGALLAGAGWLFAMLLPGTFAGIVGILIVITWGTTMLQAAMPSIVVASVPENRTSEAMGSMTVVRGMASAIGAQIIALVLATYTMAAPEGGGQFPTAEAYRLTMGLIAALTIAAAAAALLLRKSDEAAQPASGG